MTDPSPADLTLLRRAIALGEQSPVGHTFRVGSLIVGFDGTVLATGYSREVDSLGHAEETALGKLSPDDPRLARATIYSSLEPCSVRLSRPLSCTDLILAAGIPRVVFAWREPAVTVDCEGAELLAAAGRTVIEVPELAPLVQQTNAELLAERGWQ
jgi:pyrimidine deaminase RibD-like protein